MGTRNLKFMRCDKRFLNNLKKYGSKKVVHWSREKNKIKTELKKGDIILFFAKQEKNEKGSKNGKLKYQYKIIGIGVYNGDYGFLPINKMYDKFGKSIGENDKEKSIEFITNTLKRKQTDDCRYIAIDDVYWFDEAIDLDKELGEKYIHDWFNNKQRPIISVDKEKEKDLELFNKLIKIIDININKYNVDNEDIKDIEDVVEEYKERRYYEGIKKTVTTTTKKPIRNSKLAKDYKDYFRVKNGKIYCEICGQWEDFDGMLDVHHKVRITDYEEQNKEYSTFDDVMMLCPNCHRLIHELRSIEDVKKLYEN